jgi:hypothetical protein
MLRGFRGFSCFFVVENAFFVAFSCFFVAVSGASSVKFRVFSWPRALFSWPFRVFFVSVSGTSTVKGVWP